MKPIMLMLMVLEALFFLSCTVKLQHKEVSLGMTVVWCYYKTGTYSSVSLLHFSAWCKGSRGRSEESGVANCTVIEEGTKVPFKTGKKYLLFHKYIYIFMYVYTSLEQI